jgi:hypothetical protein
MGYYTLVYIADKLGDYTYTGEIIAYYYGS